MARAQVAQILQIAPDYGARIADDLESRSLHSLLIQDIIDGAQLAGPECGPGKPRQGGHGGAKAA